MSAHWSRHDIALEELLLLSFEGATRRFREQGPALLVTPAVSHGGVDFFVVNMLSPVRSVFWAAPILRTVVTRHLVAGAELKSELLATLNSSVKRVSRGHKSVRTEWLRSLLDDLGSPRRGALVSLCEDVPSFKELGRRMSCVVDGESLDAFIRQQDAYLAELDTFAFFGADDRAVMLDAPEPPSLRGSFFSGISPIAYVGKGDLWEEVNQQLLAALKREIRQLEDGQSFSFQMEPARVVNPVVNFNLPPEKSWQRRCEACLLELLSCRARLIRLLQWPSHAANALSASAPTTEGIPALGDYGANLPFNASAELEAYLTEMTRRYPLMSAVLK
jgi:hypothetical protein